MKSNNKSRIDVALKPSFFNEFAICGIPVPKYTTGASLILSFDDAENYANYTNILMQILNDLKLADPGYHKYDIQHSIFFIKSLLGIMGDEFTKTYN